MDEFHTGGAHLLESKACPPHHGFPPAFIHGLAYLPARLHSEFTQQLKTQLGSPGNFCKFDLGHTQRGGDLLRANPLLAQRSCARQRQPPGDKQYRQSKCP